MEPAVVRLFLWALLNDKQYFNYCRRAAGVVRVGGVPLGGSYPIRLQSMTTVATADVDAAIEQCLSLARSGADYVRLTTQGLREVEAIGQVRAGLRERGCSTPLVADVHFNAQVADAAAGVVEKVRVNPGNYVDRHRTAEVGNYSEAEYKAELHKLEERFTRLLHICRENHTAIRIGVNHGSLSERIVTRFGDNPRGIVESCMEFLRVCKREQFSDVVLSIKASTVPVMVRSVRLLVETMNSEGMDFPLHLGVTEAGEGEDGRMRSAVGIGALLSDGLGDTIRVSLSEAPEREIPVARKLRDYIGLRTGASPIEGHISAGFDYCDPRRRETRAILNVGGNQKPIVIGEPGNRPTDGLLPDYIYCADSLPEPSERLAGVGYIVDAAVWTGEEDTYPCFTNETLSQIEACEAIAKWLPLPCDSLTYTTIACLRSHPELIVIARPTGLNPVGEVRALVHRMIDEGLLNPVVMFASYSHGLDATEDLQIEASADLGAPLLDRLLDGIHISVATPPSHSPIAASVSDSLSFGILQAAGLRQSRTDYISCPGCGRTLYDLPSTVLRIKQATSHLSGLKIAVMGCIVNGPGEMADADYGYVGAGRGRISLYRGRECVEQGIPQDEAVAHLLALIERDGKTGGARNDE